MKISEKMLLSKLKKAQVKEDYDFFENVYNKYGWNEFKFLLKNASEDFILGNEKHCANYFLMNKIALETEVFDFYVLDRIYDNKQFQLIVSFYEKKPEFVFSYLERKKVTQELYESICGLLDVDQKRNLLRNLSSDLSEVIRNIKYFSQLPSNEKEYVALLVLENKDVTNEMLYKLLYFNVTTLKQTDKVVMLLCNSGDAKFIYRTLMDVSLSKENKLLLERRLKSTRNLEYNFYYEFYNNTSDFIVLFGSFMALKVFLEESSIFKDKRELLKVKNIVNEQANEEIENFKSLTNDFLFSDASSHDKVYSFTNKVS